MDAQIPIPSEEPLPTSPPAVQQQSQFRTIILTVIITLACVVIAHTGYQQYNSSTQERACSKEAKICPDGSSVGRSGPKCEFDPCQNATLTPQTTPAFVFPTDPTTGWNIYTRITNFTFQFPRNWTEQPNYSIQSADSTMTLWIEGDTVGLVCLTLTRTQTKKIQITDFILKYYDGITDSNCDNKGKKIIFLPFSVGTEKYSLTFEYSESNQKEAEKLFDQILSTIKFMK